MRSRFLVFGAVVAAANLFAACGSGSGDDGSADDQQVAAGKQIVADLLCVTCHGSDLSGAVAAYPGTQAYPPNLTPDDTGLGTWSDEQVAKAILDGVDDEGEQLCNVMPTYRTQGMTEEQAAQVVAYLRSLPPVEHAVPEKVSCKSAM